LAERRGSKSNARAYGALLRPSRPGTCSAMMRPRLCSTSPRCSIPPSTELGSLNGLRLGRLKSARRSLQSSRRGFHRDCHIVIWDGCPLCLRCRWR
jgi:hypothetical protein